MMSPGIDNLIWSIEGKVAVSGDEGVQSLDDYAFCLVEEVFSTHVEQTMILEGQQQAHRTQEATEWDTFYQARHAVRLRIVPKQ